MEQLPILFGLRQLEKKSALCPLRPIQYNTILFKHGKNLQFTNGKLNYILKKNENIYIYINMNTMNWFPRLPCGSKLLVTVIFRYCFSKLSK